MKKELKTNVMRILEKEKYLMRNIISTWKRSGRRSDSSRINRTKS